MPAPVAVAFAHGVDCREPAVFDVPLFLGLLAAHAGDFDDEIHRGLALLCRDAGDEVREVLPLHAIIDVGNGEAEELVLDVADHFRNFVERLGGDALPVAVHHHVIHVTFHRTDHFFRRIAVDVLRAAEAVVVVEHGPDELLGVDLRIDAPRNVAHHLFRIIEVEQAFVTFVALVDELHPRGVPLLDDGFEAPEKLEARVYSNISIFIDIFQKHITSQLHTSQLVILYIFWPIYFHRFLRCIMHIIIFRHSCFSFRNASMTNTNKAICITFHK